MRWSRVGWPAVGYVSLEDVEGYQEYLARLVTDAPPAVGALASVVWTDARVAEWRLDPSADSEPAGVDDSSTDIADAVFVVRNDEVLDTPDGLWRRWNHARITVRFERVVTEPTDVGSLDMLAGDVHVSRGELAHVDADVWELRLLFSPTGELVVHFRDVAIAVEPVDERAWSGLEARRKHGWSGPVPDGWVEWATPAVRAAAQGDVGGLSLALDGIGAEPTDVDEVDPRWGLAPLHAAAWFDRGAVTEALLERGASPNRLDAEDRSALDVARERNSLRVLEILTGLNT